MLRSEQQMSSETLMSSVIPFAGSGFVGYAMGFALKKIFKWMLIIVGFLAEMREWAMLIRYQNAFHKYNTMNLVL
jgi:uncharacterized membrane protein (Fun14 family)